MATKRTKTEAKTVKPAAKRKVVAAPVAAKAPRVAAAKPAAAAKKPVTRKAAAPAPTAEPAHALIALRAYFISEKRRAAGLPGDDISDWVEAERQIRAGL